MDDLICDGRFDARLVRENKSAKGIFITLEIAADDYFAAKLSDVRPGALLKIGYQEIADVSVQPMEAEPTSSEALRAASREVHKTLAPLREALKPKKRFEDYPLSAQCAMVCDEPLFRKFLAAHEAQNLEIANGDVVSVVRSLCGVDKSRAELDTYPECANAWRELYRHYQSYLTDQKYAGARR